MATYSNYDQDGPYSSQYTDLLNYDTYAPGSSVTSTIPGGGYTAYTGTSMSTPMVSGIASLYMGLNKNYDKELLFTQLIHQQSNGFIDAYKVLTNIPTPDLHITKFEIVDTATNCNNNGRPDAGENINLRIYLKNYSAKADSVSIKVSYAPLADTSLVHFIKDSCFVGSVSPNTMTYSLSPLNIKIADKVAHGADYKINVDIKDTKGNNWSDQIVITFQNAITFGGFISKDVTLFPNKLYEVTNNIVVDNATITIMPGTILNFSNGTGIKVNNNAKIIAIGKKDSLIKFTSDYIWTGISHVIDGFRNDTASIYKYCILENFGIYAIDIYGSNPFLVGGKFENCVFKNNQIRAYSNSNTIVRYSNIISNHLTDQIQSFDMNYSRFNNFINNSVDLSYSNDQSLVSAIDDENSNIRNSYTRYNVFNNLHYDLRATKDNSSYSLPSNIYLGSSDSTQISQHILDYFVKTQFAAINKSNFCKIPFDSCPGIVWKMTIDDKEFSSNSAQPEDIVEIGVHKLKVWFNRQMDSTITPVLSFGQRDPFNQISITHKGVWAADSKSYTVSREFVVTDPNGIVTFSVSAAKDTSGMEIPYERTRFRINLQSSASKSLNFGLTTQCGKLYLNWDNLRTTGSDIIGYNLYRRNKSTNNTKAFTLLNTKLVLNNNYTDYKVNIDSVYDYVYTAVRDGMNNETDSSFIVSGQPLHSKLADANGDSSINVADIVTVVNKILQKDPTPFIFKQTDMNNDGVINVLDVIGIINRILNPSTGGLTTGYDYNSKLSAGKASIYLSGDTLWTNSDVKIGGIEYADASIKQWLSPIANWEKVTLPNNNVANRMTYGFDKTLEQHKDIPLAIVTSDINPRNWLVSSDDGRPVEISWLGNIKKNLVAVSESVKISRLYPNPAHDQFSFTMDNNTAIHTVSLELLDINGRRINNYNLGNFAAGINSKTINTSHLKSGVYKVVIQWNEGESIHRQVLSVLKD